MPECSSVPPLLPGPPPADPEAAARLTRRNVGLLVNVFLAFYFADALLSIWDDSLQITGLPLLLGIRGLISWGVILFSAGIYLAAGIVPSIPKRIVLPLAGFSLAAVVWIPLELIYFSTQAAYVNLSLSVFQLLLGILMVRFAQGAWSFSWPFFPFERVTVRSFCWRRTIGFLGAHVLILLPGLAAYAALCASLAVGHLSEGFLALHTSSLTVQARTYTRPDGKTISLVPMMHVADPGFYEQVSASFPSNSVILLEGVTDRKRLLKAPLSYKKMAESLGVAEQHEAFEPTKGDARPADVDIEQFSPTTLEFLKMAIRFHADPFNVNVLRELSARSESPDMVQKLWDDILHKRNENLLRNVKAELARADHIALPWGALHMPGLAEGIQKEGFRLAETREYQVLNFAKSLRRLAAAGK